MQNRIPVGVGNKEAPQFPQDLGSEDKQQDDDLQRAGQLYAKVLLDKKRQHK